MKNKNVLIIGDIFLEKYIYGNVNRQSPEDKNVPIVDVGKYEYKLGGAGNVALNIKKLGGNPILLSAFSCDDKKIIKLLTEINIDNVYCIDKEITNTKIRIIGNNKQIVRLDKEEIIDINNDIFEDYLTSIIESNKIDLVILQDYDKGVLSKENIESVLNKVNIPIIVDPKYKNFNEYRNIKLIKPNYKEFVVGLGITDLIEGSKILHSRGIETVIVTMGEGGIFISHNNKNYLLTTDVKQSKIVDVSGAGDTVISVIAMFLDELKIKDLGKLCNIAGGIVCQKQGIVPITIDELNKYIKIKLR